MIISNRINSLYKQWILLLVYILSGFSIVSAQSFAIKIVKQPESAIICEKDGSKQFTVEIEIETGFRHVYTWQSFNTVTSEWKTEPMGNGWEGYNASVAGRYRCVIRKSIWVNGVEMEFVEAISNEASLRIDKAPDRPVITAPQVCNGDEITASVAPFSTNGRDLTYYAWKFDGIDVIVENNPQSNIIPDYQMLGDILQTNKYLEVTVSNDCGTTTSARKPIIVQKTPDPPTPINKTYCFGDIVEAVKVTEPNEVKWFTWIDSPTDSIGLQLTGGAPLPDPLKIGKQHWLVSKIDKYNPETVGGASLSCESPVTRATITVLPLTDPPLIPKADWQLCNNETDIVINTTGTNIKWYDKNKNFYSSANQIQINTSKVETQIYYVTQIESDKCESSMDLGKITVEIKRVANIDTMLLYYDENLCPGRNAEIDASSKVAATYRWYTSTNRTETPFYTGEKLITDPLYNDTAFYVSIEYDKVCESVNRKAAVFYVRDAAMPTITYLNDTVYNKLYKDLEITTSNRNMSIIAKTDPGQCSAKIPTIKPYVYDFCTDLDDLILFIDPKQDTIDIGKWDPPALADSSLYDSGDYTHTWWVRDQAQNMDYVLQSIVVKDGEKPKGECPSVITWDINENEYSAVVTWDLDYTDNCGDVYYKLDKGLPSGSIFPLGEHQIRYLIYDQIRYNKDSVPDVGGNIETCEFTVKVQHPYRKMVVDLRVSNYDLCPGEELKLEARVNGGRGPMYTTYSWKPRVWNESVYRDHPVYDTTYEVTVTDGVETFTESVSVRVLPRENVTLTLEGRPMEQIFEGDEILVTATPGFESYKLLLREQIVQMTGLNHSVSFQAELGKFEVQVFATDVNGCIAQDYMEIEVESKILPNFFSPNYDGKNDIYLEGFLKETDRLEVYNRAGVLLYSGYEGWDGFYKGKRQPEGTYIYYVRRRMNNGEMRLYKGEVTLRL